jgi:hypothetical protein
VSRRKRRDADLCRCSHEYADHLWGFKGEAEPCDVFACGCVSFLADGFPADPDAEHDREMAQ